MNQFFVSIASLLLLFGCGSHNEKDLLRNRENLFNTNWEFVKDVEDSAVRNNGPISWEKVTLPHTAHIEPLVIEGRQWQGTAWYRKSFNVPKKLEGKHLALHFEGAMQVADIYLNGNHIKTSYSGYLPFYVELSQHLNYGADNTLLVRLNNEDNPQVPPGKPLDDLDFNYFSGIYRNVWLVVKEKLHISDPIGADRTGAGGILVTYSNVSKSNATINVQVDVNNENPVEVPARIHIKLKDKSGKMIAENVSEELRIGANDHALFSMALEVKDPGLWSPSSPELYDLKVELYQEDKLVDTENERIGIRTFRFTTEGFELNGEPLFLRGTNRHQEYPYIGYALSDNAQYRDAWKIREAGFNFVRLSHYPHSKAFMKALDELGLLSMNAIPGWQFFGDEVFQERSLNDVRKMVRRDRNHASVVLWEASLNETAMTEEFMHLAHNAVYEEYPAEDVYTCGWWEGVFDVYIPARQHGTPPHY